MFVRRRYVRPPNSSEELEEEEEDDDEEELYKTQTNGISDGNVSSCSYKLHINNNNNNDVYVNSTKSVQEYCL